MTHNRLLVGLIVVVALVAGACSDDGGSSQVATLNTDETNISDEPGTGGVESLADTEAVMLAFAQCLRDEGFDVGDPTIDADGNVQLPPIEFSSEVSGDDPEEGLADLNERMASCEEHLDGVVMTGDFGGTSGIEDTLLEYTQCMRSNGYDMPDPDLSSGGGMIDLGAIDDEGFEAADAECNHLLADLGLAE
jgi:hypothetical protein